MFSEEYFAALPDKIRYIETCMRNKQPIRFVYVLGLVEDKDRILILKRFYNYFSRDVWDYITETEKNEEILEYFSHKVNWNKITRRVIESLLSKNEDDKIFSDEFIGRNLAKLQQYNIIKSCKLSNAFIKKYAANLDLYAVALYQNVTGKTIRLLKLNPIPLLRNKAVKTIEKDWFPNANWEKILSSFDGLDLEIVRKLGFLTKEPYYISVILKNPKNQTDLKNIEDAAALIDILAI